MKRKIAAPAIRVFKTKWFSKAAKKAGISDSELWDAAVALSNGQGDDLGGNVWKKRLNKNEHRGIIIEKIGDSWIFVFLFAKQDRDNIEDDELHGFRELADLYASYSDADIEKAIKESKLVEVTNHG